MAAQQHPIIGLGLGLEHEYGKAKTSSGKFAPQYAESKNAI
jgi:hypothetical protein